MAEPSPDPRAELRAALLGAVGGLEGAALEGITFERPPKPELGDYSTNAPLAGAPVVGAAPRQVAERLGIDLAERLGADLERFEVAGPGFLNLFMAQRWLRRTAARIAGAERLGTAPAGTGPSTLIEFVSANPTGPLTVASGRHAAYGDSLARLLAWRGHRVEREYYLNDTGGQVRLFGASIAARMRGAEVPEGGYEGAYVGELADRLAADGADPADEEGLARSGVELMREAIAASLKRFRVHHDRWASERALHQAGELERALEAIESGGLAYRSEGASWLRTTELGDDKDRVVIRADGEPTYFASDIAYHRDKLKRGYELLVDVLGADHHGYVPRLRAAIAALGAEPERFEAPIIQLVHLVEGGRRVQMSKRRGRFATLDELLDDIGVDAARFFMLSRSHETEMELDLDLARKRSSENPVYYVQYAHARIHSLLAGAGDDAADRDAPTHPSERALICRLADLPLQLERAASRREPHAVAAFSRQLAADFHAFYRDCRVLGAGSGLEGARLEVCEATRRGIAVTLGLLGVEAPEEM